MFYSPVLNRCLCVPRDYLATCQHKLHRHSGNHTKVTWLGNVYTPDESESFTIRCLDMRWPGLYLVAGVEGCSYRVICLHVVLVDNY